ncbi:MAG: glycoside hydrolase family 66 protein [Acidimicrobiales bacterium]
MTTTDAPNSREVSPPPPFGDLRTFYRTGEEFTVALLPPGSERVVATRPTGESSHAEPVDGAIFRGLSPGTYAVQAFDGSGDLLGEEFTTVGAHAGERPVHGFATSFAPEDGAEVLAWHRSLRSTVVQIYDWMASYTEPLGPETGWEDPSHRPVSFSALRSLALELRASGAVALAYAPIYAVGLSFADQHPEMLLYDAEGSPIRFLDQIVLANPANPAWQRHFADSYGSAADALGFDGFHVDTYGYPRIASDVSGVAVDMRTAYESFLKFLRHARPLDSISFNQVDGAPSAARLPGGPGFRYCEVWPPNDRWRHFEGLLDRTSGRAGMLGPETRDSLVRGSISCYPPVWGIDSPAGPIGDDARGAALRTVVSTEAIVTCLGASSLIFGDCTAALCDPYYPKHARLTPNEAITVISWRRFALRCRDLFLEGEDTSWYEIGDENCSVSVDSTAPVSPEPVGGALFARVVHGDSWVAVGVVDLTGSRSGHWSEPTAQGRVTGATVRVLVDHPDRWRAEAAVLGSGGDRFRSLSSENVAHRQGRALQVELPIVDGWSVLRVQRIGGR